MLRGRNRYSERNKEKGGSHLSRRTSHGFGSIGDGQAFEKRPGEARFNLPAAMRDDAKPGSKHLEIFIKPRTVPSCDHGLCRAHLPPEFSGNLAASHSRPCKLQVQVLTFAV